MEIAGRIRRMFGQGFERTDEGDGGQRVVRNVPQETRRSSAARLPPTGSS
jgi:hypothetical protein